MIQHIQEVFSIPTSASLIQIMVINHKFVYLVEKSSFFNKAFYMLQNYLQFSSRRNPSPNIICRAVSKV